MVNHLLLLLSRINYFYRYCRLNFCILFALITMAAYFFFFLSFTPLSLPRDLVLQWKSSFTRGYLIASLLNWYLESSSCTR